MFRKVKAKMGIFLRRYFPQIIFSRDIEKLISMYDNVKKDADINALLTDEEWKKKIIEQYTRTTGEGCCLEHPQRFTEKIQWRKVFDRNTCYTQLSDKVAVREWVAQTIGAEYLIPILGVWDSPYDIDYRKLPNKFVLKTNNASKTNIICQNKRSFMKSVEKVNALFDVWLKLPFWALTGEFQYKDVPPKIIAEKYMQPKKGESDLEDFKFYCFNGVPAFVEVHTNRSSNHGIASYDLEWNRMEWNMNSHEPNGYAQRPACLSEMVEIAKKLSKGFAHVRVDLYCIEDKVYFGEMTFTDGSGLYRTYPDSSTDYHVGEMWDIEAPQVT